jgi:hypothetical protein
MLVVVGSATMLVPRGFRLGSRMAGNSMKEGGRRQRVWWKWEVQGWCGREVTNSELQVVEEQGTGAELVDSMVGSEEDGRRPTMVSSLCMERQPVWELLGHWLVAFFVGRGT